nr:STAS domain-containing protein [Parvularcula maris]
MEPKLASRAAPELYGKLKQHASDTVVLDASKVEQIGVLVMQILIAAVKDWGSRSVDFEVVDPSSAFCESAKTLGIDLELLGVPATGRA